MEKIYRFIVEFMTKNQYAPSYQEIMDGTGYMSKSTIHHHIKQLAMVGKIEIGQPGQPRSIKLIDYELAKEEVNRKMERLTRRAENGTGIYATPSGEPEKWAQNRHRVLQKLADYEDLEAQGMLVKLPCKVGDTVWVIDEYENDYDGYLFMANCGEYVIVAVEYAHRAGDFKSQLMEMVDESYDNFGVDVEIFHKDNVFLTKEEAEQELKRLESAE